MCMQIEKMMSMEEKAISGIELYLLNQYKNNAVVSNGCFERCAKQFEKEWLDYFSPNRIDLINYSDFYISSERRKPEVIERDSICDFLANLSKSSRILAYCYENSKKTKQLYLFFDSEAVYDAFVHNNKYKMDPITNINAVIVHASGSDGKRSLDCIFDGTINNFISEITPLKIPQVEAIKCILDPKSAETTALLPYLLTAFVVQQKTSGFFSKSNANVYSLLSDKDHDRNISRDKKSIEAISRLFSLQQQPNLKENTCPSASSQEHVPHRWDYYSHRPAANQNLIAIFGIWSSILNDDQTKNEGKIAAPNYFDSLMLLQEKTHCFDGMARSQEFKALKDAPENSQELQATNFALRMLPWVK